MQCDEIHQASGCVFLIRLVDITNCPTADRSGFLCCVHIIKGKLSGKSQTTDAESPHERVASLPVLSLSLSSLGPLSSVPSFSLTLSELCRSGLHLRTRLDWESERLPSSRLLWAFDPPPDRGCVCQPVIGHLQTLGWSDSLRIEILSGSGLSPACISF